MPPTIQQRDWNNSYLDLFGMASGAGKWQTQTDGLLEKMNRTLRPILAKHAQQFGPDWDLHWLQLLFAYRVKPQDSTGEAPFYLVYGRNARLPTEGGNPLCSMC